jgi:hypothetical protein
MESTAVVLLFALLGCAALGAGASPDVSRPISVEVADYAQRTIYHSPEVPGYTCWVGLWLTPDGRIQCSFTQKTGPKDNPVATAPVLESRDKGLTWRRVNADTPPGKEEIPRGSRGMAVLKDGTLVCPRWTSDPNDAGYVQRSTDGGTTWGDPIYFVPLKAYRAWPTMIRPLRDGRLVLMAGVWKRGDGEIPNMRMTKMMFVSKDQGRSWGPPITLMPTETGVCEESDFCELPNGDLFWVHRVEHFPTRRVELSPLAARMAEPFPNGYSDRMQSIVRKKGDAWEPGPAGPAPFPHSGFPCVLLTREGVILHLATDGTYWTSDFGNTWTRLSIPGAGYYPCAVQLPDGTIVCIGHVGSDDVYGTVDQSIVQQTFRLKVSSIEGGRR